MNHSFLVSLLTLFIFSSSSCATMNPDMEKLVKQKIPEYISQEIERGDYLYEANNFRFDKKTFDEWIIEENIFEESLNNNTCRGPESCYKKKYKDKKEKLIDIELAKGYDVGFYLEAPQSKPKLDVNDVETYWMLHSCWRWLEFVRNVYDIFDIPLEEYIRRSKLDIWWTKEVLSRMDEYCYRIINPERTRVYDVIFIVSKRDDFTFDKEDLLHLELKTLKTYPKQSSFDETGAHWTYEKSADLLTYRHAFFIEPLIEYTGQVKEFSLLQLIVKRTTGGRGLWGVMHAGWEKRIRDTYIFILTGKKVKLIIQTFYHPKTKVEEIEKDLKTILDSITIK